jgi:catechol 2,3-dioxygenase-like lactoylglutathione lyase family enzyme
MSSLGRFLEFSVRTPDILESLAFYRSLGFTELESGDIWSHKYAVVSDGILNIGLHDRDFVAPAISFVRKNIAKKARNMTDHGFDFNFMQLGEDAFNELGLADRDGHQISMVEARTFHAADDGLDNSVCGTWFELSLPARDVLRSARFWGSVAPNVLQIREEPTTHMRFDANGAAIGLSESIALECPSLCFKCDDRDLLNAIVEKEGLRAQRFPGYEGAFLAIRAPEGTMLYLFDEDFLGEPIEVEEDVDPDEFPR